VDRIPAAVVPFGELREVVPGAGAGKPIASEVPPASLRDWLGAASPLGHPGEIIIPETFTLTQAVRFIQETSGMVYASPGIAT
jgi:hypothetical protein